MNQSKPVIYRAIFGGYDDLPKPPSHEFSEKFRFILITGKTVSVTGWENLVIESNDPVASNRECKFEPWLYFSCSDSFYFDGHVSSGDNFESLAGTLLDSKAEFAVLRHRGGGTIGSEFFRCINHGKIDANEFARLLKLKVDFNKTAVECGFIYRKHYSQSLINQANNWKVLFQSIVRRDQLIIYESFRDTGGDITIIDSCFNSEDDYLRVGIHKNGKLLNIKTRFFKALKIIRTGLFFGTEE